MLISIQELISCVWYQWMLAIIDFFDYFKAINVAEVIEELIGSQL